MKRALRITVNVVLVLAILAHIVKGPGHDRLSYCLTYAVMFAAGTRLMGWVIEQQINWRIRQLTKGR